MATKENDMQRQKLMTSEMLNEAERQRQESSGLRAQVDALHHTNTTLQENIRTYQDVISEQKVCQTRTRRLFTTISYMPVSRGSRPKADARLHDTPLAFVSRTEKPLSSCHGLNNF